MARSHRSSEESPPERIPGWAPLSEDQSRPSRGAGVEDGTVTETGTTVVGLKAGGAVVLAADRRASVGGRFVTGKRVRKVEPVHPTAAAALSGAVGGIQSFVRTLRAETSLYRDRRGEEMSVRALATLAGNVLRGAGLRVTPLLGGVGAAGPYLAGLDGAGGALTHEYAAGGSGMQVAYGALEREYDPDLSVEEARSVAASAVEGAGERDTASGDGLTVATVTVEGVDVEEHDDPGEVA